MSISQARPKLVCLAIAAVFSLIGCKEVLYSDLDERQANEMVSVLAASGISAGRERDKKGIYAVLVDEAAVATAVTLLKNQGLPRERFQNLGDVFSSEGIVGTPFEQQARYLHAMNQELSHTVTSIDGVRSARVLVTAPPRGRYEQQAPPASASVVIHHESAFDQSKYTSTIKTIVAHSLPNLSYEDVAVAMFMAGGPALKPGPQPGTQPDKAAQADTSWGSVKLALADLRPKTDLGNRLIIALGLVLVAAFALLARASLSRTDRD